MELANCKIFETKIGHRDVKVLVELFRPGFFGQNYKMTLRVTGEMKMDEDFVKGDYFLVAKVFESYDEKMAEKFVERFFKRKDARGANSTGPR